MGENETDATKYFSLVEGMKLCPSMTHDNATPKVLSMVILQLTNVGLGANSLVRVTSSLLLLSPSESIAPSN